MDVPQNFRSALNGFRREDVVRYLEYLNAKHTTQVNQLTAEADSLREQLQQLEAKLSEQPEAPDCTEELEELRTQLAAAQEENNSLNQTLDELTAGPQEVSHPNQELEQLKAEKAALEQRCAQLESDLANKAEAGSLAEQELEAYRRAERAERVATEKADLIYHRANSVLDEASSKIDGASSELTELADRINGQLQQMQYTINSSKIALKNAVDTMQALHEEGK